MRLLFVTSTRIGDAVLSTGLLSHLIGAYPEARITVACGKAAAGLFAAVPNLERILPITKRRAGRHWLDLWLAVAGKRWDVVVDLRASALAWMLRAGTRVIQRPDDEDRHRVQRLGALLDLDPPPAPHLWILPEHRDAAVGLLPAGKPVVALGPAANWIGKTWPAERFVELALRLTGTGGIAPGGRIAIMGGPEDVAATRSVVAALPAESCIDLVGRVDLLTVFACLQRCALYVGNDSGLMHLAAASGTPTLGLFGPSREAHYAPWGGYTAAVRTQESYDSLITAPGYDHLTTPSLMGGLTVDATEAAARALWRQVTGAAA